VDRSITISLKGEPIGKGRPRSFVRRGKLALYTPSTRSYEDTVRAAALQVLRGKPAFEQAVEFTLRADFAVPPSWSSRKQQFALAGDIRPRKRPDLDNVLKNWLDGLSGVSFVDDALIVRKSQAQIQRAGVLPRRRGFAG
jgi:Holliday junction resolvase RusA-like endonuclease